MGSWNDMDLDESDSFGDVNLGGLSSSEGDPLWGNSLGGNSGFTDLFSEENEQIFESLPLDVDLNFSSAKAVEKLSAGKVVGMIFMGLLMSCVLFVMVFGLYTRYIRFPDEQERVWEASRLYALEEFTKDVGSVNIKVEESYLMQELPYANGNADREKFMKYVMGTVEYSTDVVNKKNVFGNDLVDPSTMSILTENSWLESGEECNTHYIDYSVIEFDSIRLKELIKNIGLTSDDIDYRNKLTDLFCQYIYGIDVEELPLVSIRRVPYLEWNSVGYDCTIKEDIYLDKALFSSADLYDCFERFSQSVAKVMGVKLEMSEEYRSWNKLSDATKETTPIPMKYGKHSISHTWCGAYYMVNEYDGTGGLEPQLGNGSREQPASIGTPVITYIFSTDEDGNEVKLPIRVTMTKFGVSQDAIEWFQAKDVQNRGYDVTSELQYCYYVFEVTNLSKEPLVIYDNTALCDINANTSGRTGTIYGLQDAVYLEPEETGIVESWGRSTELNLKYVIWGSDFDRRENPVWFRVLAGDLEDPSDNKGVYINDTRG